MYRAPQSGSPPSTLPATAPPASFPVDERPFQEHRRAQNGGYLGDVGLHDGPDEHLLDLHLAEGVRNTAYTETGLAQARKRHPVDTECRVFVDHHGRGIEG